MLKPSHILIPVIFLALVLSACNVGAAPQSASQSTALLLPSDTPALQVLPSAAPTETLILPTPTFTLAPATPTTTHTVTPSSTPTLVPTDTLTPTATETATPVASLSAPKPASVEGSVKVFFIQENTGGPLCGDSLVAVGTDIPATSSITQNVTNALKRLFSYHSKYVGGYYNPAHVMNATVKSVKLDADGTLFIQLSGTIKRTQDDCELDRLRAQIWSTFRQTKGFERYVIKLNNAQLGDLVHSDR